MRVFGESVRGMLIAVVSSTRSITAAPDSDSNTLAMVLVEMLGDELKKEKTH